MPQFAPLVVVMDNPPAFGELAQHQREQPVRLLAVRHRQVPLAAHESGIRAKLLDLQVAEFQLAHRRCPSPDSAADSAPASAPNPWSPCAPEKKVSSGDFQYPAMKPSRSWRFQAAVCCCSSAADFRLRRLRLMSDFCRGNRNCRNRQHQHPRSILRHIASGRGSLANPEPSRQQQRKTAGRLAHRFCIQQPEFLETYLLSSFFGRRFGMSVAHRREKRSLPAAGPSPVRSAPDGSPRRGRSSRSSRPGPPSRPHRSTRLRHRGRANASRSGFPISSSSRSKRSPARPTGPAAALHRRQS